MSSSKRGFQDCSISIRELEVWNRTSGANSLASFSLNREAWNRIGIGGSFSKARNAFLKANEVSMTHNYASGIHYSMVEHGGFLRNATGLSHEQWIHLHTLERANLMSSRTARAEEFMNLVRQRYAPRGPTKEKRKKLNQKKNQTMDHLVMELSTLKQCASF